METHKVIKVPETSRFEIRIVAHLAVLDYEIAGETMVIHRTFVPPELRGMGLAAQLAEAALSDAEASGLSIDSRCSYIDRYIQRRG